MFAVGCLIPFVLLALGAVAGGLVGGITAGFWGGGAGFVIGIAIMLAMLGAFERVKGDLPE